MFYIMFLLSDCHTVVNTEHSNSGNIIDPRRRRSSWCQDGVDTPDPSQMSPDPVCLPSYARDPGFLPGDEHHEVPGSGLHISNVKKKSRNDWNLEA